ncbi:MAG: hypothetical protein JETCAE03_33310 [Ignavibacteriaceae bacterium]|jgi:hypothetical protein|nr:MAG: hypothetical protein JETCAE03_33310 [Ignavibacteriaceae bacterium]
MKKEELRQLIREEIKKVLKEDLISFDLEDYLENNQDFTRKIINDIYKNLGQILKNKSKTHSVTQSGGKKYDADEYLIDINWDKTIGAGGYRNIYFYIYFQQFNKIEDELVDKMKAILESILKKYKFNIKKTSVGSKSYYQGYQGIQINCNIESLNK